MNVRGKVVALIVRCFGLWLLTTTLEAGAQGYPIHAIRMVVPFPPGGGTDVHARVLLQRLSEQLAVSMVIDNRPGAGAMMGTEAVAKAPPDGYTLLLIGPEFVINPSLQPKVTYDPLTDFAPVSQTVWSQYVLSIHPSIPINSVKEFIALAKARPGQLNYGTGGNGSAGHLAGVLFQRMTGTRLMHIAYKGAGPAIIALMSGEVAFMFGSTSASIAPAKSGKLRAIAVTGPRRFSEMPDIPTVSEAGVPGFVVTGWFGVLAPAGTPREIVNKLGSEIVKTVQHPAIQERFAAVGTVPVGNSSEEFAAFLRVELDKWSQTVKESGARPDHD